MRFIYPSFLWALLFTAIPIIIHLVNLRRHQTVYFSNVNFLKKVKKETQRKSKLKQFLILCCRVLAIAGLVFAFAKPYIPTGMAEKQYSSNITCIYIDNSFSMNAEGSEGKAIENAKQKAYTIIDASEPNTKFALLTNNLDENYNRFFSKQEVKKLIGEIEEGKNQAMMSTILLRFETMTSIFLDDTKKKVFLISDFQKHTSDLSNLKSDSLSIYNFVKLPVNSFSNIYIDSCWYEAPAHHLDQVEIINVRIVNRSKEEFYQIPVNLYLNDSLKALATADLAAGEEKVVTLQYTNLNTGLQLGKVEITDYPIVYDNTLYFSYNVNSTQNSLLIKSGGPNSNTSNIEAIFSNDPYLKLDIADENRLQISRLSDYSTIIIYEIPTISTGLTDELKKYVANGGTLIFIPSIPGNIESYNTLLGSLKMPSISIKDTVEIPINEVSYSHQIYSGVFKKGSEKVALPSIHSRYRFNATLANDSSATETPILQFADKSNAMSEYQTGLGKVYAFSFPVSDSQNKFLDHILFMPTFYNIVLYSSSHQQLYSVISRDRYISVKNPNNKLLQNPVIRNVQTGNEIIPEAVQQEGNLLRMSIDNSLNAGFYHVYLEDELIGGTALNFDLKESDLTYHTDDEIITLATQAGINHFNLINETKASFSDAIQELDNGKQMWKLFIYVVLLFLLIEFAIIKFWDKFF